MSEEIDAAKHRLSNPHENFSNADVAIALNHLLASCQSVEGRLVPRGQRRMFACVYGLFREGELQYIGQTQNLYSRLLSHRSARGKANSPSFDSFAHFEVPTGAASLIAERRMVRRILPPCNDRQKAGFRKNWGWIVLDDLAEVLNMPVDVIAQACADGNVPIQGSTHDLQAALKTLAGTFQRPTAK